MKRFIRFVAKSDFEGINDLTSKWMDTETTNLIDVIEMANAMNSVVRSTMCFKGREAYIEEADEVVDNTGRLLSAKKELNSLYGKKMVKISDLLDNDNYYVNCKTEAEAVEFVQCMIKVGCEWYRDTDDIDTNWFIDKEDTCYYVTKIYNPGRYVLRRISKNDIYKVYSGEHEFFTNYTIFNWEDVIHA